MKPILKNIDHIHVSVPDRQEALKWYGTVLGLEPVKKLLFWAKTGPLTIGNDEGSIHIALFEGEPNSTSKINCLLYEHITLFRLKKKATINRRLICRIGWSISTNELLYQ